MKKILVVSHERSGTHFLINTLGLNFWMYDPNDISIHTKDGNPDGVREQYQEYFGKREKRIFKSHHQFEYFKPIWDDILKDFEVFYMVRDPRGALVSSWLYHKTTGVAAFPQCNTFSEWLHTDPTLYSFDRMYSLNKSSDMLERWCKHVETWLSVPEVRVVTYRDLSNDFDNIVQNRLAYIIQGGLSAKITKPVIGTHKSICPRCGRVDDWKNHLGERSNNLILRELLARLSGKSKAIVLKNNNLQG